MPVPFFLIIIPGLLISITLIVTDHNNLRKWISSFLLFLLVGGLLTWFILAVTQERKYTDEYTAEVQEFSNRQFLSLKNNKLMNLTVEKGKIYKNGQLLKVKHTQQLYLGLFFFTPPVEIEE